MIGNGGTSFIGYVPPRRLRPESRRNFPRASLFSGKQSDRMNPDDLKLIGSALAAIAVLVLLVTQLKLNAFVFGVGFYISNCYR